MKRRNKRILIVEDNLQARLGLERLMKSIGHDAEAVGDWLDAVRLMREQMFDLAIVDVFLARTGRSSVNGLDLIPLLRIFNPQVPVVLVTGQGDDQLRELAMKRGATLYLEKPLEPGRLTRIVRHLLAEVPDHESIS